MSESVIFGNTIRNLEQAMNFRSIRHKVITSNIANKDTPNYKAFDLVLEDTSRLLEAPESSGGSETQGQGHIPVNGSNDFGYRIEPTPDPVVNLRGDGNTVNIDRELTNLSENVVMYQALAKIVQKEFQTLSLAIQGGE